MELSQTEPLYRPRSSKKEAAARPLGYNLAASGEASGLHAQDSLVASGRGFKIYQAETLDTSLQLSKESFISHAPSADIYEPLQPDLSTSSHVLSGDLDEWQWGHSVASTMTDDTTSPSLAKPESTIVLSLRLSTPTPPVISLKSPGKTRKAASTEEFPEEKVARPSDPFNIDADSIFSNSMGSFDEESTYTGDVWEHQSRVDVSDNFEGSSSDGIDLASESLGRSKRQKGGKIGERNSWISHASSRSKDGILYTGTTKSRTRRSELHDFEAIGKQVQKKSGNGERGSLGSTSSEEVTTEEMIHNIVHRGIRGSMLSKGPFSSVPLLLKDDSGPQVQIGPDSRGYSSVSIVHYGEAFTEEERPVHGRLPGRLTTNVKKKAQIVALLDHFRSLEVKGLANLKLPPASDKPILATAFDGPRDEIGERERLTTVQKRSSAAWVSSVSRFVMSREMKPNASSSHAASHAFKALDRRQLLKNAKNAPLPPTTWKDISTSPASSSDQKLCDASSSEEILQSEVVVEPAIDLFADELDDASVLTWLSVKQREEDNKRIPN